MDTGPDDVHRWLGRQRKGNGTQRRGGGNSRGANQFLFKTDMAPAFIEDGYDSLESLSMMDREDILSIAGMQAGQVKPMLEAVKELRDTLANGTKHDGHRAATSTANSTAAAAASAASAASAGGGKAKKPKRACELKRDAARSHAQDAQTSQSDRERDADSRARQREKAQSAASGSGGGAAGSGTTRLGQNGRGSGGGGQAREQERAKKGPTKESKEKEKDKESWKANPDSMFKLFVGGISKANCSRAMLQAYFSQCVQRETHTPPPPHTHTFHHGVCVLFFNNERAWQRERRGA
jgi:hypothetical protein